MEKEKPRDARAQVVIPYEIAIGSTWNQFYEFLKEDKIMGRKCNVCSRVYVPPRTFCPDCFCPMDDWVEVGPEGTIDAWALINFPFFGQVLKIPYISAQIRLDGAGTAFTHQIAGIDLSNTEEVYKKVKSGNRVRAVWNQTKTSGVLDIAYFELID